MVNSLALVAAVLVAPATALSVRPSTPSEERPRIAVAVLRPRGLPPEARPRAIESLMAAVARRTAVEVDPGPPAVVAPRDPALFEHPLVFLSGTGPFEPFDDDELDAMRGYLSLGGMVVIDDPSGDPKSPFAVRARGEMSRALGGRSFEPLPAEHAAFRSYYLLDRAWGRLDATPELTALVLDKRAAVVYSANDMLGAWARDEFGHYRFDVRPGGSEQREMAVRLGVNLVLHALTLDYKEDLVHLPLILERRR